MGQELRRGRWSQKARSPAAEAGIMQAHVFLVFAGILLLMLPLVSFVPEHRGNW